ncbi:unnamed protein product, partial [Rotaria magnacalcarata]
MYEMQEHENEVFVAVEIEIENK